MRLVIGETKNETHPYAIHLIEDVGADGFDFFPKSLMKRGARFVSGPENGKCMRKNSSKGDVRNLDTCYHFGDMLAKSAEMHTVFKLAEKVAKYNTTVLITGESGTGKELVAKGIHQRSDRARMPLIPVNCGGIPENLLESEFFGYTKGAFTGAESNRKGLFEEADGGTIFLDEIGELPIRLQVKLLRVLQEREIMPIGGSKTKKVDVRVVAATAKDLEEEVRNGNFRQDLFYRLNVVPVKIPPLKNRTEDIPLLCGHFIEKFKKSMRKEIDAIASETLSILCGYHWPGNVRELENVIERAAVLADGRVLLPEHFPYMPEKMSETEGPEGKFEGFSLKAAQKILEKKLITLALAKTGGNRSKATQLLEISHPSLLRKIKDYNINV